MTKEELKKQIEEIDKQANRDKIQLAKAFAVANNSYKVGDIIKDHVKTIRINNMHIYVSLSDPQYIYTGVELLKSGKENKLGKIGEIFQCNIIKDEK